MNVRRVQVRTEDGSVRLRIESGYATVPMIADFDLDPATALFLSGCLEASVHTLSAKTETQKPT